MLLWLGGGGGRVRLSKRIVVSGSLLMMVLLYYISLPEASMYPRGKSGESHKESLADDVEIVTDTSTGERISLDPVMEIKSETIGKSSKQRNYNFGDSRADAESCGLISNDNSDNGSCAPAAGKKNKELEKDRLIAIGEDSTSESSKEPSKTEAAWRKAKEQESIQEEDDAQGSEREDGSMMETEAERIDREEKETIAATIEAEIEREEAEFREVNKYANEEEEGKIAKSADNDDDEEEEDEGRGGSMHRLVESLFQDDQEPTDEEGYRKEDRLGQAGPLETMDDEE